MAYCQQSCKRKPACLMKFVRTVAMCLQAVYMADSIHNGNMGCVVMAESHVLCLIGQRWRTGNLRCTVMADLHLLCLIGQGWHTLVWPSLSVWSQEWSQGPPGIPPLCKGFLGTASIPDNHSWGESSLSGLASWKPNWAGVSWVWTLWLRGSSSWKFRELIL